MKPQFLTLSFCLLFALTYSAHLWINQRFTKEREELRLLNERTALEKSDRWRRDSERLQQDFVRARSDLATRQQAELEKALGGPMKTIVNDPRLNIRQMIRAVAAQAAPAGSQVNVRVDRFTDFQLNLEVPASTDDESLVRIANDILRETSDYLSTVLIVRKGEVAGELTRDEIQSVYNWGSVERPALEKLLRPQVKESEPEFDTSRSNVRPAQAVPAERARLALNAAIKQAAEGFQDAVKTQNEVFDLKGFQLIEISARQKRVVDANQAVRKAGDLLRDTPAAYERMLKEAGVSAEESEQIVAEYRSSAPKGIAARRMVQLFESRSAAGLAMLDVLERNSTEWELDATGDFISFKSARVSDLLREAQRLFGEETVALERAMADALTRAPVSQ
ncbi:MAG TPA: hypothetical protein VM735_11355 [Candidatus Kapabacteria bacterium]|nr:hypothetical protein [Candidatus Kapabacteria bacterium]